MGLGFGVNAYWFPKQQSSDLSLTKSLAPLGKHREDISLVQNLSFMPRYNAHYASQVFLSGADLYKVPGKVQNSVSCDQMIAKKLNDACRFPSLSLKSAISEDGYGHGRGVTSLSVDWSGRYIPGIRGPLALYNYMLGKTGLSPEELKKNLQSKRSILDYYNNELKRSEQLVPASGKDILQEYADSVRDLEKRLSHALKWREIPYPQVDYKAPGSDLSATQDLFLTYELMALALKYDLTRVITYALPTDSILKEMESEINAHGMSHYEKSEIAFKRDAKHSAALAHFLDKLKETKTPDGKDLLYHTTVTYGAGCRHGHGTKDIPMIVAGQGGGRYEQGKNIILPSHTTDVCDLWYTILKGYEPEMTAFKSGRNEISELLA